MCDTNTVNVSSYYTVKFLTHPSFKLTIDDFKVIVKNHNKEVSFCFRKLYKTIKN